VRNSLRSSASARDSAARTFELERELLRHLCRARLTRAASARIFRELNGYAWQDVEHEIVYAAIRHLASRDSNFLPEQLPAQTTRMGFPDIDWGAYIAAKEKRSAAATPSRVLQLIRQLRGTNP
jgi:hypothetical protein